MCYAAAATSRQEEASVDRGLVRRSLLRIESVPETKRERSGVGRGRRDGATFLLPCDECPERGGAFSCCCRKVGQE
jgi:hypothetical protein